MKAKAIAFLNQVFTVVLLLVASVTFAQQKDKLGDTSTGSVDVTSDLGGISDAEVSKSARDAVRRFKKGRMSSGEAGAGNSRYSGILEMHDSDFNGVTDHGGANNALEGGTEKAAVGRQGMAGNEEKFKYQGDGGDARRKILADAAEKHCAGRKDKQKCLENTSGNILDRGAAHGKDEDEDHRVYDLRKDAITAAEKAGKAYGEKVVEEAAYVEEGAKIKKGSAGNRALVKTKDGWKEQKIGANIDLLRDEASKLEEIKSREMNNQWKLLRGQRLAGALISSLPSDAQGPAQREINAALPELVSSVYRNATDPNKVQQYDRVFGQKLNDIARKHVNEYYANEKKKAGGTVSTALKKQEDDSIADLNKKSAKVANCMKAGVWCDTKSNPGANNKNIEPLEDVSGKVADIGGVFQDTREFIYHEVDRVNRSTTTDAKNKLGNMADLNASTDAKAVNSKPYQALMKQAADNKKVIDQFLAEQRQKQKADPNYKSPYLRSGTYDPTNTGAAQLSKRDPRRGDGSTLGQDVGNSDLGNGPGAQASSFTPPGGAPKAAPRTRGPAAVRPGVRN